MLASFFKFRSISRIKTPMVLQMEAVECGAAALAIILAYYGRFVSLEQMRVVCGVSRDGTKASNILEAAKKFGLKGKGFSKQPEELREFPLPMIVFWNFNHFVVIEGFGEDRVYLNDPSTGHRVVTLGEFDGSFTGVVLVFEKGSEFRTGGARLKLLPALRERLRGSFAGLLYVLLASLALALVGLCIPLFTKLFVDSVLVARMHDIIRPLLIGMLVTALLRSGVTYLQRTYLLRLSTKLSVISSYKFFRHLLRLPIEFFTQRYAGEVGARMEINDRLASLLSGELAANLLNLIMILFYAVLMLSFDVPLTIVGIVFASINLLVLKYVSRRRADMNARALQETGQAMSVAMSGLQSIETLKATGSEAEFFSRWSGHLAKQVATNNSLQWLSMTLSILPGLLSTFANIIVLGWGAMRVMDGVISIGTLVAFQSLLASFMSPVNQLVMLGSSLQEVDGSIKRLDDVLNYPEDANLSRSTANGKTVASSAKLMGHIDLQQITYGYNRLDEPLISKLDLSLRPGERVALVGPSASGKSTVAKLITGLSQPWAGEVLFDGQPRQAIDRTLITNSLALVDQDFFLHAGTVREVLTMWDSSIQEEDIMRAAKDACIHDDIVARAGGYDCLVEEGGRNFSNGQRQRLEIARALVGKPTILVLDEATSALDPLTEKAIAENIRRRGCTCVIVAHRLSTIRDCDEIIVLDHGAVVQRGTHSSLHSAPGVYQKLVST